jgi:serine/threonine-protein kinase RsbW
VPPTVGPIVLSVPADAGSLQVLRAVAASVASRMDLSFDAVDEVRMAVDEAASLLLGAVAGPTTLELRIDRDGPTLHATLVADGVAEPWPAGESDRSWSWRVVQGLCDQAAFERSDDGRPAIRLRISPSPVAS